MFDLVNGGVCMVRYLCLCIVTLFCLGFGVHASQVDSLRDIGSSAKSIGLANIEGFNKDARLDRETTIMGGGECCTFRYTFDNTNEQG